MSKNRDGYVRNALLSAAVVARSRAGNTYDDDDEAARVKNLAKRLAIDATNFFPIVDMVVVITGIPLHKVHAVLYSAATPEPTDVRGIARILSIGLNLDVDPMRLAPFPI